MGTKLKNKRQSVKKESAKKLDAETDIKKIKNKRLIFSNYTKTLLVERF